MSNVPTDSEMKLMIFIEQNTLETMDVLGKYVDGEWYMWHGDDFIKFSDMATENYELTLWVNVKEAKDE